MKLDTTNTLAHGAALIIGMGASRLAIALAVIVSVVMLTLNDKITGEATIGILSALVGYVVGAGHEAAKSDTSE